MLDFLYKNFLKKKYYLKRIFSWIDNLSDELLLKVFGEVLDTCTDEEAAQILGISVDEIGYLVEDGKLKINIHDEIYVSSVADYFIKNK